MGEKSAVAKMGVDLGALQAAFGLPRQPEVVSHHHGAEGVWRVRSTGVDFAFKVKGQVDDDWTRTQAVNQSRLELAALKAGVPMPEVVEPRSAAFGLCAEIAGFLVELHRWVEPLPDGRQTEPAALHQWLGATLSLLHTLIPLDGDDDLARAYAIHPVADWADWIDDAKQKGLPWVPCGVDFLEVVPQATEIIRAGLADPTLPRCLTHRDVNPSNVLHTADGPLLCDFAYAGPDVGWLEAVSTAASFDAPDVLASYLASGGHRGPTTTAALAGAVGSAANWLAFNMWLSLGHRDVGDEVRLQATDRVAGICRDVIDRVADPEADQQVLFSAITGEPPALNPRMTHTRPAL